MLAFAKMIVCLLRITGLFGAFVAFVICKVILLIAIVVVYLATAVLLQHAKAAYLDDVCETVLCLVSLEARKKVLMTRVRHLQDKQFHSYYHGRKPAAPVLFEGLSIVCDWWRTQNPTGMPPSAVVYLRLTCKTLHQLEQLAATHLNLKAPLYPSGVQGALNRPARWRSVQAVSYFHHKPEQLHALTLFASVWPNLRHLRVSKPQYLHLRQNWDVWSNWVWQDSSSSSSSKSNMTATAAAAGAGADPAAAAAFCDHPETAAASSSSVPSDSISKQCTSAAYSSGSSSVGSSRPSYSSKEGAVLHLVAGLVSSAHHWPFLQCLSLSNLGLTPAAAQLLVQAAAQWPLLRCLDVTYNNLGAGGVHILIDAAMQYWHQLEVIDIRGNLQLDLICSSSSRGSSDSSSSSRGTYGSSSSSGNSLGLLELLGSVPKHVSDSMLWDSGCRKVVVQSPKILNGSAAAVTAADVKDHLGNQLRHWCDNSSSSDAAQQQVVTYHSSCRFIPTEGLISRHVYLVL